MKPRIAVFTDSLEPLFFSEKYIKSTFGIVSTDTPFFSFVNSIFPKRNLIMVSMHSSTGNLLSDKKILYSKDFLRQLKDKRISHLVMPYECSRTMHEWGKKNHISLIGTPYNQQAKFENKVYFDRLLKKNKISSPLTLQSLADGNKKTMYVVQRPLGRGLVGTSFTKPLQKNNINKKGNVLIREYKSGISIGASIFINRNGNYFFSAFRRQCFLYKNKLPDSFLGIQWLPTDFFSHEVSSNIYSELFKLAEILKKKKFIGIANIDLIVSGKTPYIIECNPRLSAATAQVFSIPQLTTVSDPYGFFLNTFLEAKSSDITNSIPASSYQGCLMDIEINKPFKVVNLPTIGIYAVNQNGVKFTGSDMRLLNNKNHFLMTHEFQKGGNYAHITLCTIISHFPLFDFKNGSLNRLGKNVYNYMLEGFLSK